MRRTTPLAACAMALLAGSAVAQDTATFNTLNMTPEIALAAAQAAQQACRDQGYQVTAAVTDRAGVPIALLRDRYAGPHTVETATRKAYTAASFNMDTVELAEATRAGTETAGIRMISRVLAVGGGLPVQVAGSLIGGIGVSGAPGGAADRDCAQAGIDAVEADLEF